MERFLAGIVLAFALFAPMCSSESGTRRSGGNAVALYPLKIQGKYGFINGRGEVVIRPVYSKARWFKEGVVVVEQKGRQYHIDSSGKAVYESRHDVVFDFSEGFAQVLNQGLYGFINRKGEYLFPLPPGYTMAAFEFSQGLSSVEIRRKSGFIDATGRLVIPCKYDYAGSFSEGLSCAKIGRKYGFIDAAGNTAIDFLYDEAHDFSEGLAAVLKDGRWGYVDKSGRSVIAPSFSRAWGFSEGLAAVAVGPKWGYIDKRGQFVITPKYRFAGAFSEGLAAVTETGVMTVFDYIDRNGNSVCSTPRGVLISSGFENGIARFVFPGGKSGYMNRKGEVIGIDGD